MHNLIDFLEPLNTQLLREDGRIDNGRLSTVLDIETPDITNADIVIIGAGESRGGGNHNGAFNAPDIIRKHLYGLYYWHTDVNIADIGNVKQGATLQDSYAALKTVIDALLKTQKTIIILGGSQDLTIANYNVYKEIGQPIELTCIDAKIDLRTDNGLKSEDFLMEMLTDEPQTIRHYNHIGFQSYYTHPELLQTMDKLRFDCYRLGKVKENIEEMEPVIRNTHLLSFDISAIKNSDAPSNTESPNGLTGEEACMLSRYAGMSNNMESFGIYGYNTENDVHELTAKQIAQMIWYFIDGKSKGKKEKNLNERNYFNEFHTAFAEVDTVFLQSKKTGRWWIQLPNKKFIACSFNDYLMAGKNEIPERWLRAQERE